MIARDDGGCGYFRIEQIAAFINRAGLANVTHTLRAATIQQIVSADLVVLQDIGSASSTDIVRVCEQNKIPFMVEIDDFLHHVSPHNSAGYGAWNPGTLYIFRAMEQARKAVALTVSTPQLAREYYPYNENIYVRENYLDKDLWDNPIIKRQDGKIRIGWMGGNAHMDDLKMIAGILEKIANEYDGKVIIETFGMLHGELPDVFHLTTQRDQCGKCGYEGQLHNLPGVPQNQYPLALCSTGWDIAIAPVINNSFGNCKSDLKIKEYAAARMPIVASNVIPYCEAAKSGAMINLAENADEWYAMIKYCIEHPEARDEMIRTNHKWVSGKWIQDNVYSVFEIYRQIISKVDPLWVSRKSMV